MKVALTDGKTIEARPTFARADEECCECAYPLDPGQWCLVVGEFDRTFCGTGCVEDFYERRRARARERGCIDCGEPGELTGHQGCQYPGRLSDPNGRHR